MEEQSYDPVLGSEELARWRLMNPLRPPAPGRALVLVRDSGPSLTIHSGEEIPSSRFGAYHKVFTVDTTEHRLILDIPLLSRDPTFSFRSRVDLVCRVADPARVVSRGIRDMSGALYGFLRKTLRGVARDYDIAEFHEAEQALNSALAGFTGDDAVRLRGIQIELLVDEDEITASGREFRDVVRETRLAGMRRKRHLDMIREEGVDGLIAEIMEKEGARAALAWIEKGEAEKREVRREVMRMILERGDADREPFEQAELERAVLDEVLRDGDGLFDTATRRGRLRGTMPRALEADRGDDEPAAGSDASEPVLGEVVRDRYDDGGSRGGGDRTSRIRRDGDRRPDGRAASREPASGGRGGPDSPRGRGPAGTSGPPADEPLPPEHGESGPSRAPGPSGSGSADGPGSRVSRIRGTAKRPRGGTSGTGRDEEGR
ncbi:hypothetical protein HRW23_23145 [Streptomyces lunaelactis]|uniref:hypothetical protein n=1 Tax=Streptomyces lunaelactis TaxID=1535768 RepID=UPI001584B732|nr:hypothetical protein [Streptomyces lunaelactis]NUK07765.1 hypothetical protein [Streptomyces lunaelactis]NUK69584.1 hypothetical protein [Streptomyces lunaelactis]NUK80231.1 hypothetical protein [Streptomyces lunaelactis]NUL22105.1 hypothetical protein [Streptomyces lunaelactis]